MKKETKKKLALMLGAFLAWVIGDLLSSTNSEITMREIAEETYEKKKKEEEQKAKGS